MKKILIFSLAYFPKYIGGAEVAIKEITDRIDPGNIEFHMVTLSFDSALPKESREGNVLVHRVGFGRRGSTTEETFTPLFYLSKILFVPIAAIKAWQLNKRYHYDALWAMMSYMLFPIVLSRFLGMRLPYLLTLEEGDPFKKVYGRWRIILFYPLLKYGFRKAHAVHAESNFLGTWARRWGFRGPLEVIPNAVDTKYFSKEQPTQELQALEKKLGKHSDEIYLITTSRLVHKNAVDVVIKSLKYLPENVYFLVLGVGPDEKILRELAERERMSGRVKFLGHIEQKEIPKYMKISDIFVRPSRSEGMGNSFIEAMAAGLPIIATQEGGIADFLFDAERNLDKPTTGWAVDKDSPSQIAEAVKKILGDRETTKKVVENARKLVFEKFDWNLIARDMREKVFARLLS